MKSQKDERKYKIRFTYMQLGRQVFRQTEKTSQIYKSKDRFTHMQIDIERCIYKLRGYVIIDECCK